MKRDNGMDMMKALVYEKPGRINGSIKEIPRPACGDDEVLMKVMACAICKPAESSHDRSGSLLGAYPATPGHEFAGIAVKVGKNVTNIKIGDRITADNAYPCGTCYFCQSGKPAMCENYKCQGHNMQGGFAQYIACKAEKVYTFPEDIGFDSACLCELINCALSCVKNAELQYGDNVVVLGAGSSGNLIAQLLRHSSAGRIVSLDPCRSKLDRIAQCGVETVLVDLDDFEKHEAVLRKMFPYGVDVLIDAAGDDGPMLEQSMKLLAPGGRLVIYSFFYFEPKAFKVEPGIMIRRGLKLIGAPLQMHNFGNCVKALESKKINTKSLISGTYPLERYFEALDRAMNDKDALKIVIHPNG